MPGKRKVNSLSPVTGVVISKRGRRVGGKGRGRKPNADDKNEWIDIGLNNTASADPNQATQAEIIHSPGANTARHSQANNSLNPFAAAFRPQPTQTPFSVTEPTDGPFDVHSIISLLQ